MSYKYFMKGALCALIEKNGKYLLIKRANTGYFDGFFAMPGGKLDPGETLKEGICRELREEVNIDLSKDNGNITALCYTNKDNSSKTILFSVSLFIISDSLLEPTNAEPEKCDELKWFSLQEIKNMSDNKIIPIHKFVINKLILNQKNRKLEDFINIKYKEGFY